MSHKITIKSDGTRIDIGEGRYDFPLSIDLKITNYCTVGCPWCHESSGPSGKHAPGKLIIEKLSGLPKTTEIAIGGGNPLEHPELQEIINSLGCIVNMTVRDTDLDKYKLPSGISGLGISITPGNTPPKIIPENSVAHLILGINTLEDYERIKKVIPRVLWLGFKVWGRNRNNPLPDLSEYRKAIVRDLYLGRNGILAFDNLALSQLNLKSAFLKSEWEKFYLGSEFTSSMYVDAVQGVFSGYSTSPDRVSWDDIDLITYFRNYAKDIK